MLDPATPQLYTLSLHDALPISAPAAPRAPAAPYRARRGDPSPARGRRRRRPETRRSPRSEEHTSELQSHSDLVCRLLLEKKKKKKKIETQHKTERNSRTSYDAM